jgi:hypothetical protein
MKNVYMNRIQFQQHPEPGGGARCYLAADRENPQKRIAAYKGGDEA